MDTFNLGLGWLQVQGALAAIPALMIWTWGLTAALIAVRNTIAPAELQEGENVGLFRHLQVIGHQHPQRGNLSGCLKSPTRSGRFSDVRSWPHFSVR